MAVEKYKARLINTYLSSGDHDTDLLDSLGELIRLNSAVVVQVKVLEGLEEDSLLVCGARRLGRKLGLQTLFETSHMHKLDQSDCI